MATISDKIKPVAMSVAPRRGDCSKRVFMWFSKGEFGSGRVRQLNIRPSHSVRQSSPPIADIDGQAVVLTRVIGGGNFRAAVRFSDVQSGASRFQP
jgi:hypothetical protein